MNWATLPSIPEELASKYPPDIPPLLAQLLYNRGVTDPSKAESFLAADARLEHDPFLLPDIDKAISRIMQAINAGEMIGVFGDFDADGVTAAAVMVKGLEHLGARVIPYIPHRVEEGHGLNNPALKKLHDQGISLVITVDCGVTSQPEAEYAIQSGLDLIITDHHEAIGLLPQALAIIDPKLPGSAYPFRELAGVGVAYKVIEALFDKAGQRADVEEFLDLVALGTVADLVPLLDENRYLVNRGIQILNGTRRTGIHAMIETAGLDFGTIDAENISYALAPRLNAPGRLDHASISYDILITDSYEEARRLAEVLDQRNNERQNLTREYTLLAESKLGPITPDIPILIVADTEFHAGVNGVVAGKLADKYYRPAIVIETGEIESNGSARSIPEFNLIAAMQQCSDLFHRYGGHEQAAGFGMPNKNLAALKQRLMAIAKDRLSGIELQPTIKVDTELRLSSMGQGALSLVKRLEPCGKANSAPTFLSRGIRVLEARPVGNDGEHLKLKLGDRGAIWDAIAFRLNHLNSDNPPLIDIVYNLKLNRWRGQETLQLDILDFAPSM